MSQSNTSWTLVSASNSENLLKNNLLKSFDSYKANNIEIIENAKNAGIAYNHAIDLSNSEVLVFAHQDVFLPFGWIQKLFENINYLNMKDPKWGVIGVYGMTASGEGMGHVYSTGLKSFIGNPFFEPTIVSTLDEMILIIRKSSRLKFDEKLPGFHLYGTDICLESEAKGMINYVVPCFALHNSRGHKWLPYSYWKAYFYLKNKWPNRLPVFTPCVKISFGSTGIIKHYIEALWSLYFRKNIPGQHATDPEKFYNEFVKKKIIPK